MKTAKILSITLVSATLFMISCKEKEHESIQENAEILIPSDTSAVTDYEQEVTESASSTGSENWDSVLDNYEEYVDQYVVLYKKAMKGDTDALTEYAEMLEKAEELQKSMIRIITYCCGEILKSRYLHFQIVTKCKILLSTS